MWTIIWRDSSVQQIFILPKDNPSKYKMQFWNNDFICWGTKSCPNLPGPKWKSSRPINNNWLCHPLQHQLQSSNQLAMSLSHRCGDILAHSSLKNFLNSGTLEGGRTWFYQVWHVPRLTSLFNLFRCCSGFFYAFLDESSLHSWSNFGRPATSGKVHHCSKFYPFVHNGSDRG